MDITEPLAIYESKWEKVDENCYPFLSFSVVSNTRGPWLAQILRQRKTRVRQVRASEVMPIMY